MKRREFLRTTAALAATGAIASSEMPHAHAALTPSRSPEPSAPGQPAPQNFEGALRPKLRRASHFFEDPDMNYVLQHLLGAAYYRAADIGTCLTIADQIIDGDRPSALRALLVAGDRLSAIAETSARNRRQVSAREAYMQAANYIFWATYFVDPVGAPDAFTFNWLRHQELWDKAAKLHDPPVDYLPFPYEKTTLPGYFFKVDDSGKRRPLLILNNSNDGGMVSAWTMGVAAALERGYNAYTFYGPGQGTASLQQKLYSRPDWERVISPLLDYLLIRREVDPTRIALLGISDGGYCAARAVAFDSRLAACVVDPGIWDISLAWIHSMSRPMIELLETTSQAKFDNLIRIELKINPRSAAALLLRIRPFGLNSAFEAFKAARQYNLSGIVNQIRCPMLITDPEGEQFWTGQSQKLFDALSGSKTLMKFTFAEGGDLQCEPKIAGLRAQRIFDWLDETLILS
jgi:hypothetical protein